MIKTNKCQLIERSGVAAVFVRTRSAVQDLPGLMPGIYAEIAQYLGEIGGQPAGPPYAAYYNMDMQDLDIEIGFPVSESLSGKGNIQTGEIAGGSYATCLRVGPYSEVAPAYNALTEWVEEEGLETTGVAYEFYLNDPAEIPPEKLQTQILYPLE